MANQSTTVDVSNTSTKANVPAKKVLHIALTEAEPFILTAYLLFCLVAIIVGNTVLFVIVYKNRALHTQHYFVLCSLAVCDIVTGVTMYPTAVMILFQGSDVLEWFCRANSTLGLTAFCTTVYVLGLLAYERYHFFCRPLSYESFLTTSKLSCVIAAAVIVPLGYAVASEIAIGRKVTVVGLTCILDNDQRGKLIRTSIAIAPSVLVILWSLVRVSVTWATLKRNIAPVQEVGPGNDGAEADLPVEGLVLSSTYRAKARKLRSALKLIILVSGLFWGTILPGYIAGSLITSSGVTMKEIETGRNMKAALVFRYRNILAGTISQVLNPLLYLYTHPELSAALKKLMKRPSSSPPTVSAVT